MRELDGRVAVVTGAGSGQGRATALELAGRGAAVALFDLEAEITAEVAAQAENVGGSALAIGVDVAQGPAVREAMQRVVTDLGPPYVCATAAGVFPPTCPLVELTDEAVERTFGVNYFGTLYTVREAVRHMIPADSGGRVILWSSGYASRPYPHATAYYSSKMAVEGLTRLLAGELGPHGITVNAIAPGLIETPMTQDLPEFDRQVEARLTPLRRLGRAEEVAKVVAWLASDDAAWLSGAIIPFDGGMTAINTIVDVSGLLAAAVRGEYPPGVSE